MKFVPELSNQKKEHIVECDNVSMIFRLYLLKSRDCLILLHMWICNQMKKSMIFAIGNKNESLSFRLKKYLLIIFNERVAAKSIPKLENL